MLKYNIHKMKIPVRTSTPALSKCVCGSIYLHSVCIYLYVVICSCGKTTVCQLFAERQGHRLSSVNCNLHTESSDFLGGLRPVRHSVNVVCGSAV